MQNSKLAPDFLKKQGLQPETKKLLEANNGNKLSDSVLNNIFLDMSLGQEKQKKK